jgi:hypothetical protein
VAGGAKADGMVMQALARVGVRGAVPMRVRFAAHGLAAACALWNLALAGHSAAADERMRMLSPFFGVPWPIALPSGAPGAMGHTVAGALSAGWWVVTAGSFGLLATALVAHLEACDGLLWPASSASTAASGAPEPACYVAYALPPLWAFIVLLCPACAVFVGGVVSAPTPGPGGGADSAAAVPVGLFVGTWCGLVSGQLVLSLSACVLGWRGHHLPASVVWRRTGRTVQAARALERARAWAAAARHWEYAATPRSRSFDHDARLLFGVTRDQCLENAARAWAAAGYHGRAGDCYEVIALEGRGMARAHSVGLAAQSYERAGRFAEAEQRYAYLGRRDDAGRCRRAAQRM